MQRLSVAIVALAAALLLLTGGVQADRAGYDDDTGMAMVLASAAAYCKSSAVENWSCKPCARLPMDRSSVSHYYESKYNVAGFVGLVNMRVLGLGHLEQLYPGRNVSAMDWENEKAVLVSFRGTTGFKDWINNLKFSRVEPVFGGPCSGCKVHKGFQQDFISLRNNVNNKVQQLVNQHRPSHIILTGHSLGGALATMASWELLVRQWAEPETSVFASTPMLLYTFGQPRVGNEAFTSKLRASVKHTWRVVHKADMVPHLPPKAMGFHHQGQEIWFAKSGPKCNWSTMCAICEAGGEDKRCSNSLVPFTNIPDHMQYLGLSISGMC